MKKTLSSPAWSITLELHNPSKVSVHITMGKPPLRATPLLGQIREFLFQMLDLCAQFDSMDDSPEDISN